ncbi:GrdB-related putative oxidoreductase [Pseudolactococcus yaeyamensis]
MKILMVLNQIQAGIGTKDDTHVPLTATQNPVGPGSMMKSMMAKYDEQLLATIYCGTGLYEDDKAVTTRKIVGMVKRLGADVVICGPSFDYLDFSKMSLEIAQAIQKETIAKAVCAMSGEMTDLIAMHQTNLTIVRMPKKGGTGLNDALENICKVVAQVGNHQEVDAALIY